MAAKTNEGARRYDFRRPDRFGRDNVRSLEVAHEVFSRRFASALSSALRAVVQIEPLATDQMSFDDYQRSMPTPTVVGTAALAPLPGIVTIEIGVQLALVLVDRLLGGTQPPSMPVSIRRPTDLESFLVRDLIGYGAAALGEAITPLVPVTPEVVGLEYNPQLVQAAGPSDTVLLLTYRILLAGTMTTEGILTVGYPTSVIAPLIDRLASLQPNADQLGVGAGTGASVLDQHVGDVVVELNARLRPCSVPAHEISSLRVGDVLRLEHRADEPVRLAVDDVAIGAAHVGRRGRRLAVQVAGMRVPPIPTDH